jgi:hypothetical protein
MMLLRAPELACWWNMVGEAEPLLDLCFFVGEGRDNPKERGSGDSEGAIAVLARVRAMVGVAEAVDEAVVGAGVCSRWSVRSTKASRYSLPAWDDDGEGAEVILVESRYW